MISMVKRTGMTAAAVMAAIALASCGGSDDESASSDSGSATTESTTNGLSAEGAELVDGLTTQEIVACLKDAGTKNDFTVSESEADLDDVARKATVQAVALDLGKSKAMVIIQGTEQEANKVISDYRARPQSERAAAFAVTKQITVAYKEYDVPTSQSRAIGECTKYGVER